MPCPPFVETGTEVCGAIPGEEIVRDLLWRELERVVGEVGAVLGAHLRERPIAVRRDGDGGRLVVGRTRLRLEPGRGNAPAVLGSASQVVRWVVFREERVLAVLWADVTRLRWTSTETEGEIFRLDDRAALESFFFALFVDAGR